MDGLIPGGFADAVVLDAFAGSGALGIEALSRGARHAVLCELARPAQKALKRAIDQLGVGDKATLVALDCFAATTPAVLASAARRAAAHQPLSSVGATGGASEAYDAVFLDPPYQTSPAQVGELVCRLVEGGCVREGCVLSYEQAAARRLGDEDAAAWLTAIAEKSGGWLIMERRKTYGTRALDYFRYAAHLD
jgi:16S rRNA (guanine966-N2)-methyltransferase